MKCVRFSCTAALIGLLTIIHACISPVSGHSWLDCIDHNPTKASPGTAWVYGGWHGAGYCEGYSRNYPSRGDVNINTKYTHKILAANVYAGAPVCASDQLDSSGYTGWRTMAKAKPGEKLYFAYMMNGHIVKDKPTYWGRGTTYGLYWSGKAGVDLTSTHQMVHSNLIDGKLHDFDDGNCGETKDRYGNPSGRAGDGVPCRGSFSIPHGTKPGVYQIVWFWRFYKIDENGNQIQGNGQSGYYGAAYSDCFDIEVLPGDVVNDAPEPTESVELQEDNPQDIPDNSCSTTEENVDYYGNDIGSVKTSDKYSCCDHCKNKNGCKAFTWSKWNGGTCWLKSSTAGRRNYDGAFSGTVQSSNSDNNSGSCDNLEHNVDYYGNDIGPVSASKAEMCCSLCANTVGCEVFTWSSYNGGTCWLKHSKGSKKTVPGAVSGRASSQNNNSGDICSQTQLHIDFHGNDVGFVSAGHYSACCGHCQKQTGCKAYTWTNYNGGTCWLKSAATNSKSYSGAISAVLSSQNLRK